MGTNTTPVAFEEILEQHIRIILKIARAYTHLREDREDLVNDIVLELWKSFNRFRGDSKLSTWIYQVSLNTAMNYRRKEKRSLLDRIVGLDSLKSEWLRESQETKEADVLYHCIDLLNEVNKAIILLYLDNKSHEEIASIIGITKTNVGTRLGRIKEHLKKLADQIKD